MKLHTASGTLTAKVPFDFTQSLNFLGIFPLTRSEQVVSGDVLTRGTHFDGQMVVFQVKSTDADQLEYTLFSQQTMSDVVQSGVADRIAFFLSLDDDLSAFYKIGKGDPKFAPIIQKLYGYHQVKFLTPFENAVWAILSQRNPIPLSEKMKNAITERYGSRMDVNGISYQAFPEAAQLNGVDIDELAAIIRHGPKATSIADAARAFASMDEAFLHEADYDDVYQWLRQIRGIGDWSASFVLLRALGRVEHFPRAEKRIIQAASRVYNGGGEMTQEAVERLGERYGAWKGYWAHYLRVGA